MQSIPTLDVSHLEGNGAAAFVDSLGRALLDYGFVSVTGAFEVSEDLTAGAYAAMQRFFALPEEVKLRYHVTGGAGERGYTPFGVERAKDQTAPDLKEFWHVGRELPAGSPHRLPQNLWPREVPEFEPVMLSLWRALHALGARLLSAIARFLGLSASWFESAIDHGNSILRPLHYPPVSTNAAGVRSAAHEDINLITLLVGSGEPGLELLRRDGRWLPVETQPGAVVVNVGDMLQRLTNHVLPSTTHRVVNPPAPWAARSRYSAPFFLHPNPEFVIETLPGCITRDNPNRYPEPIVADAYLRERLRAIGLL
jgi:isopenicillin N synthase-like dioxygenase